MSNIDFIFFGTSRFSVIVLDALKRNGLIPKAVVTSKDKPQGRKMVLTPNPVKVWATENQIEALESIQNVPNADLYVVASFGKILPSELIYKPKFKTLNVHPSLLPKLRGPAPIQGAILSEDKTGVSIMRLNEKMDEGPIISSKEVEFDTWPSGYLETEEILANAGGELLAEIMPKWISGELKEVEQDGKSATYTKMINKEDAEISQDTPEKALRKIKAYEVWPRARINDLVVTDAHIDSGELILDSVIPPGKHEMSYKDYLRGKK